MAQGRVFLGAGDKSNAVLDVLDDPSVLFVHRPRGAGRRAEQKGRESSLFSVETRTAAAIV